MQEKLEVFFGYIIYSGDMSRVRTKSRYEANSLFCESGENLDGY